MFGLVFDELTNGQASVHYSYSVGCRIEYR